MVQCRSVACSQSLGFLQQLLPVQQQLLGPVLGSILTFVCNPAVKHIGMIDGQVIQPCLQLLIVLLHGLAGSAVVLGEELVYQSIIICVYIQAGFGIEVDL